MRPRAAAAALIAGALLAGVAPAAAQARRARFDTRVFALVPRPGFPAMAYVHPNGRVYEGTYVNPLGDAQRSRVFEYTGDGTLQRSWTVQGQDLAAEHGVQVATSDAKGRLLLLDRTPARALLLDLRNGRQTTYATFRDLPACAGADKACSPALRDEAPEADYAAWDEAGNLYVTDYQQAVIWRVPPGGGRAQVWLADPRLDGDMFGTAGLSMTADHHRLMFAQASSAGGADGNPATGKLYTVGIRSNGRPGRIRRIWESGVADAPDGFAIAASGRVYVALSGPASQIAVIAADGHELERFPQAPLTGDNGSGVPFDTPSSAEFLGNRLMVANQSFFSGSASSQAILDVEVNEPGLPELVPPTAG